MRSHAREALRVDIMNLGNHQLSSVPIHSWVLLCTVHDAAPADVASVPAVLLLQ
jgi:hypothetical protein